MGTTHGIYEELICNLTGGQRMAAGHPYDVLSANKTRLEVKGSKLRRYGNSVNGRWEWTDLLGKGRTPKQYDRLILVGDTELMCETDFGPLIDEAYYYFDVPYQWVLEYTCGHPARTLACAHLKVCSRFGRELWNKFACAEDDLAQRYGQPKPVITSASS